MFQEMKATGDLEFNPLFALPPEQTCTSYTGNLDLSQLLGAGLGGEVPGQAQGVLGRELDAGKDLSVTGPKGNTIPMPKLDAEENKGPYLGLLGGSIPLLSGDTSLPLFLDGGRYTIRGPGGKDFGAFTATIDIPAADRTFTVPSSVLGNLPPSVGDNPEDSIGALLFGTLPVGNYTTFTAPGMDRGHVFYTSVSLKTVPYE
jgi:hypothetical protein